MRRIVMCGFSGALTIGIALAGASIGTAATSSAARVLSPTPDAIVGRVAEIVFETTKPGVPVVLIAAESETVEWWVQPTPNVTKPGRYSVAAHFGNSKTPQGTPFHAVVVLMPNEDLAKALVKQQVIERLPQGLETSKPVRLLRRFETDATVVKKVVTSPAVVVAATTETVVVARAPQIMQLENGATVKSRQEVRGMAYGTIEPVILVRAKAPGNQWWVQDRVKRNAAGEFTAVVRFGNDKTPAGSEFQMVALTPRSTSEAAQLKVGESMSDLPKDSLVSSEITLVLAAREPVGAD